MAGRRSCIWFRGRGKAWVSRGFFKYKCKHKFKLKIKYLEGEFAFDLVNITGIARQGDIQKCQTQLDQLDYLRQLYPKTNSTYHRGAVPYLKARIYSIFGENEQAVEFLNASITEGRLINQCNYHFDQDLLPLKGYPSFESILEPKG
jgi:hypothetical protein